MARLAAFVRNVLRFIRSKPRYFFTNGAAARCWRLGIEQFFSAGARLSLPFWNTAIGRAGSAILMGRMPSSTYLAKQ
jgi:hypothetical protein